MWVNFICRATVLSACVALIQGAPTRTSNLPEGCPQSLVNKASNLQNHNGVCYWFAPKRVQGRLASGKLCSEKGGSLLEIKNKKVLNFILGHMKNTYSFTSPVWLNLGHRVYPNSYFWEDGTEILKSIFKNFDLSYGFNHKCFTFKADNGGTVSEATCSRYSDMFGDKNAVICQFGKDDGQEEPMPRYRQGPTQMPKETVTPEPEESPGNNISPTETISEFTTTAAAESYSSKNVTTSEPVESSEFVNTSAPTAIPNFGTELDPENEFNRTTEGNKTRGGKPEQVEPLTEVDHTPEINVTSLDILRAQTNTPVEATTGPNMNDTAQASHSTGANNESQTTTTTEDATGANPKLILLQTLTLNQTTILRQKLAVQQELMPQQKLTVYQKLSLQENSTPDQSVILEQK